MDECKHIRFRQQDRFAKCDYCQECKWELRHCRLPDKRKAILRAFFTHLEFQMRNRRRGCRSDMHHKLVRLSMAGKVEMKWIARCLSSPAPPELYVTMDCADQKMYQMPRRELVAKTLTGIEFPHFKALGWTVWGVSHGYHFIPPRELHGACMVVDVLNDLLKASLEGLGEDERPSQLKLQLDNTAAENKNKYVLGYCAILIILGVFESVELHFLIVGHTHGPKDGHHSILSRFLMPHHWSTTQRLLELTTEAFPNGIRNDGRTVHATYWSPVLDWVTWMNGSNILPVLHGVTGPNSFRLSRDLLHPQRVLITYKDYMTTEHWQPPQHFIDAIPEGAPAPGPIKQRLSEERQAKAVSAMERLPTDSRTSLMSTPDDVKEGIALLDGTYPRLPRDFSFPPPSPLQPAGPPELQHATMQQDMEHSMAAAGIPLKAKREPNIGGKGDKKKAFFPLGGGGQPAVDHEPGPSEQAGEGSRVLQAPLKKFILASAADAPFYIARIEDSVAKGAPEPPLSVQGERWVYVWWFTAPRHDRQKVTQGHRAMYWKPVGEDKAKAKPALQWISERTILTPGCFDMTGKGDANRMVPRWVHRWLFQHTDLSGEFERARCAPHDIDDLDEQQLDEAEEE
ncbi:unnamed protein product [Vitrella brassicaformis CCMP3155]|uniref:DUF7869 domain-containing protein n=1 Tax=Vitrella brassicaformis (strain CCMP3155) TaxID=1169540 RepID=A0A0G4GW76_VITBC|nr:unnamed protein product [Vitrella brassicaformis CCMP3155]|mmetsp:Transcript_16765/g.47741  ORF Transcript_16765/g.47741 Transcript_16765/m.47741 type:complete len:626 (-) Transcript_16765:110-1987(-)|eukprot:CEM35139.1 unnamed protein product [Vitrella brassicaformis CCMP3155]